MSAFDAAGQRHESVFFKMKLEKDLCAIVMNLTKSDTMTTCQ